jgi:hypothetical protein
LLIFVATIATHKFPKLSMKKPSQNQKSIKRCFY